LQPVLACGPITIHYNGYIDITSTCFQNLWLTCAQSSPHIPAFAVADGAITIHYNGYAEGSMIGTPQTLEVDMVIGADGANSRVAKEIDAGEYDYAIAFQERIRIPGVLLLCYFVL
jgi:hypothetical protein